MSEKPVKVTVSDPETGAILGAQIVENNYLIICAGNRYVDHVQAFGTGTQVVTIKRQAATA